MCGRYALALSNEEVYDALQNQLPRMFQGERRWEREQDYRPNYNIAPRQRAAVIHRDHDSGSPVLETMQWGLIPHWTKHPPTGAMNTINARSESLLDPSSGGMWQSLKAHERCVIPAQGYYEWHKRSPTAKVAHFTRLPLGPKDVNAAPPLIFFAGLWDVVKYLAPVESKFQAREGDDREPYPTGNPLPLATYTILTTTPTKDIEWLHDRMPCVLQGEDEVERWLGLGELAEKGWEEGKGGTGALLRGMPGLDCYPVNPEVGKIGTNSPTYIQPVSERSDGIKSFFQKQAPSPAKSKGNTGKSNFSQANKATMEVKKEGERATKDEADIKEVAEEIKTEVKDGDEKIEVKGAGDDSNAPNPSASADEKPEMKQETSTPSKRKRSDALEDEHDEGATKAKSAEKRGGHQTKIIRRSDSDDTNKVQPSITNFFQSPSAKKQSGSSAPTGKSGSRITRQTKR